MTRGAAAGGRVNCRGDAGNLQQRRDANLGIRSRLGRDFSTEFSPSTALPVSTRLMPSHSPCPEVSTRVLVSGERATCRTLSASKSVVNRSPQVCDVGEPGGSVTLSQQVSRYTGTGMFDSLSTTFDTIA